MGVAAAAMHPANAAAAAPSPYPMSAAVAPSVPPPMNMGAGHPCTAIPAPDDRGSDGIPTTDGCDDGR